MVEHFRRYCDRDGYVLPMVHALTFVLGALGPGTSMVRDKGERNPGRITLGLGSLLGAAGTFGGGWLR